jgi:hypothetical protein
VPAEAFQVALRLPGYVRVSTLYEFRQLTNTVPLGKVCRVVLTALFFASTCWEVGQLVVRQILDLIILVRVQASQPNLINSLRETKRVRKTVPVTGYRILQRVQEQ